jgi:predicted RNase H-like nuclease (RuvC/YqgF family)
MEGEDGPLKLSNGKLFALEEEVSPRIADYVGRGFVIVDKSVLQDLQVLKKEREASLKKGVEISDVKKLIEEYRKQRWG